MEGCFPRDELLNSLFLLSAGGVFSSRKYSKIAFGFEGFVFNPVSESINNPTMPSGCERGILGVFLSASLIKSIQIGKAARPPVSLLPNGLPLSRPTQATATNEGLNPLNQASL